MNIQWGDIPCEHWKNQCEQVRKPPCQYIIWTSTQIHQYFGGRGRKRAHSFHFGRKNGDIMKKVMLGFFDATSAVIKLRMMKLSNRLLFGKCEKYLLATPINDSIIGPFFRLEALPFLLGDGAILIIKEAAVYPIYQLQYVIMPD